MNQYLADNALMLIGVLPSPKDMEIARVLGWYRIPMRMAPKIVDVDYLAFYQTGAFGEEHRWRIESYAPVKGHELTTRRELLRDEPDHPRAGEEYYKIQLGPINYVHQPIHAGKWKRVTFLYTTGALFNRAENLHDLVVRSDERELLWKNLRERVQQGGIYSQQAFDEIDPSVLAMMGALFSSSSDEDEWLNF